jgi:hypothetical protein
MVIHPDAAVEEHTLASKLLEDYHDETRRTHLVPKYAVRRCLQALSYPHHQLIYDGRRSIAGKLRGSLLLTRQYGCFAKLSVAERRELRELRPELRDVEVKYYC